MPLQTCFPLLVSHNEQKTGPRVSSASFGPAETNRAISDTPSTFTYYKAMRWSQVSMIKKQIKQVYYNHEEVQQVKGGEHYEDSR